MDRPYLRLAPFKVEIVHQKPLAVLFHDIISDEEARIIELLAVPEARLMLNAIITLYYSNCVLIHKSQGREEKRYQTRLLCLLYIWQNRQIQK